MISHAETPIGTVTSSSKGIFLCFLDCSQLAYLFLLVMTRYEHPSVLKKLQNGQAEGYDGYSNASVWDTVHRWCR